MFCFLISMISDHEISVNRAVLKSGNAFNHNERFMLTVCAAWLQMRRQIQRSPSVSWGRKCLFITISKSQCCNSSPLGCEMISAKLLFTDLFSHHVLVCDLRELPPFCLVESET